MFKNLFIFSHVRTRWSALGFYVAWFFMAGIVGGLAGAGAGLLAPTTMGAFDSALLAGNVVAFLASVFLAFTIVKEKNITHNTTLFTVGTAILSALGGAILGLIIPAYLTTKTPETSGTTQPPADSTS
jgi:uncharacterized membrane protein YfcA